MNKPILRVRFVNDSHNIENYDCIEFRTIGTIPSFYGTTEIKVPVNISYVLEEAEIRAQQKEIEKLNKRHTNFKIRNLTKKVGVQGFRKNKIKGEKSE